MAGLIDFISRKLFSTPEAIKEPDALRIGILGAASIAPAALINPARSHPGVVITAVAARDRTRADKFAKQHGIQKVYASYQELLDDPSIDAVYNPLPNGLHYEWTLKAIKAGKHVLLEKPSCNRAEETRRVFDYAKEKGVVVLEAFHYRFHPSAHRLRQIVSSGELGTIQSLKGALTLPRGIVGADDIRYNYSLGGGSLMDGGTYPVSFVRFLTFAEPVSITSAHARPAPDARVDVGTIATLAMPGDVSATIECDMALPPRFWIVPRMFDMGMTVKGDKGEATLFNFVLPMLYHYITVKTKDGKSRTEKVYVPPSTEGEWECWPKAEASWSTYRYQLEAFVDKIQGRKPHYWVEADDSVKQMEAIEQIYAKSGLGSRPASTFVL
ncbi:NAD(P)-binding protein [Exidia glandulosa HHB12029]|uniref:D-xylose 1-dehydrogenase (NADP(+), D-xylono-1,5-lactone-forming) n=1 Tax=Exidia glandulosa HHB12029 TaxID=1314781 RepID=A0A165N3V5_EXIGL|nr:NAD(P)-binding protein [Exidia glandulosa HHB12029]